MDVIFVYSLLLIFLVALFLFTLLIAREGAEGAAGNQTAPASKSTTPPEERKTT